MVIGMDRMKYFGHIKSVTKLFKLKNRTICGILILSEKNIPGYSKPK